MPSACRKHRRALPVGAIDPGGRFAIALDGASWLVWDIQTQRPVRIGSLRELPAAPSALALSADGQVLWIGGGDGTVSEFDLPTGRTRWAVRAHRAAVVAVTADGRVRSVAADRTVWVQARPASPERSGVVGSAVRVALAVATVGAVGAGWVPAAVLAVLPALLGYRARRRFRLRLSLSGSAGVSRV